MGLAPAWISSTKLMIINFKRLKLPNFIQPPIQWVPGLFRVGKAAGEWR